MTVRVVGTTAESSALVRDSTGHWREQHSNIGDGKQIEFVIHPGDTCYMLQVNISTAITDKVENSEGLNSLKT